MKRFLIYLGKIFFITFLIAFIIQELADFGLRKSDIRIYRHWDAILAGEVNSELLILGSSRAVVSYDPDIFSKNLNLTAFNLGFDAAPYNLQSIKLDTYLVNNKPPKVLIQNLDLTHFSESRNIPNIYQFIPFFKNKILRENLSKIEKGFGKYYYIPLTNYNDNPILILKALLNIFSIQRSPNNQGYNPINKEFSIDVDNIIRLQKLEKNPIGFSKYLKGLNALEEKLQNEIHPETAVFLVWAPEHFERLKYAAHVRENVENHLEVLSNKFPNVYFLNYSKDSISLNTDLYYDTFHLNKKGASLFSEKVSKDIFKMLN